MLSHGTKAFLFVLDLFGIHLHAGLFALLWFGWVIGLLILALVLVGLGHKKGYSVCNIGWILACEL